jgi:hypothetical protein
MKNLSSYISICIICCFSSCNSIPSEIKRIVFETSEFKNPISLDFPQESSRERYQNILNNPVVVDDSFLPKATLHIRTNNELNQSHIAFLIKKGFIHVEKPLQKIIDRFGEKERQYEFIFYSDKFNLYKKNILGNKLQIGKRVFSSLIDVASDKIIYYGTEVKMKKIAFMYKIRSTIEELKSPSENYKGIAIVIKSPTSGSWTLYALDLNDDGPYSIISMN